MPRQHAREMAAHDTQALAGRPLGPGHAWARRRERKIEGAAHPGNFVLLRELRDGLEYRRQQVRVLVRIEMRGLQTGVEDAAHLRLQLVIDANAAERHGARELRDGRGKGRLAHQHQMDADIERRVLAGQADRIVKRRAGGHQRGCGEDALAVRFDNPLIHVAREAEVVGVNHQFAHVRTGRA